MTDLEFSILSACDDVSTARGKGNRHSVTCVTCPETRVQTSGPDLYAICAASSNL